MEIPENIYYTKEHEWAALEGDIVTIGITDYAQGELGDIVFVELPEVGTQVAAEDSFGVIEAVKTVSDLFAPVTGEIVEVNDELTDNPALINTSPYEAGWIIKIKASNKDELENLLDAAGYQSMLES
ncbi:glycine cleavage system protein GcvH [candidate division KSB1 bacterium]